MGIYETIIIEATHCPPNRAEEIEEIMRHVIFMSTLDDKTKQELQWAARLAWEQVQWCETPEGQHYVAQVYQQICGQIP